MIYTFTQRVDNEPESVIVLIPVLVLLALVSLSFYFYFIKLFIENVEHQNEVLQFKGDFSGYLGKILLGFLLTIITIGIYFPWFMKSLAQYFVGNTQYKENSFEFKGKGIKLFLIFLLALIVPMIIYTTLVKISGVDVTSNAPVYYALNQFISTVVIIPYIYYYYRWFINVQYKEFEIKLQSDFLPSVGKIFLEIFLTMITVGIYFPMAYLRIFKYFVDHAKATSETAKFEFGLEIQPMKDFLFLWGQLLLTIITVGIYAPWAITTVYKRFLNRTFKREIIEK